MPRGQDSFSSTASIASSIFKFRVENGRTYNGYGDRSIAPGFNHEVSVIYRVELSC